MSGGKAISIGSENSGLKANATNWLWPECPNSMRVYDKYSDLEQILALSMTEWVVPVQGKKERFRFPPTHTGFLQKKLAFLSQAKNSPSALSKFLRSTQKNWSIYLTLLEGGPDEVYKLWGKLVHDVDTAKAGKTILKLALKAEIGGWTYRHATVVKSLDTRAKASLAAQRGTIIRREKLLSLTTQAEIVKILDESFDTDSTSEPDLEGLVTLAMTLQHAMRPVQLLALKVNHVSLLKDATGDVSIVVSFHAAKQSDGKIQELRRQIKTEWSRPLHALYVSAVAEKRSRLFTSTTSESMWTKVVNVCKSRGFRIDFKAYALRHTAAQALADAGHDRESIRGYLAHRSLNAATVYLRGSRLQEEQINKALGVSKLYSGLVSLSRDAFVTLDQILAADPDKQIGGIVGNKLIAGIGLCGTGQSLCKFNPVTSCYGCHRFMPVARAEMHKEAIAGMRDQINEYLSLDSAKEGNAYKQLESAIAVAQEAIEIAKSLGKK